MCMVQNSYCLFSHSADIENLSGENPDTVIVFLGTIKYFV